MSAYRFLYLFILFDVILICGLRAKATKTDQRKPGSISYSDPFHPNFACAGRASTIVGGSEAIPHSQPWNVYLKIYFSSRIFICSGSVISDRWVISASHCFVEKGLKLKHVYATIGAHDVRETSSTLFYVIPRKLIFIHKKYDDDDILNTADIALLRLPARIPRGNPHVQFACLPTDDRYPKLEDFCVASGWGSRTGSPNNFSTKLHYIDVKIYLCAVHLYPANSPIVCTAKPPEVKKKQDSCSGDSGGPLMCTVGGKNVVVGVLSSGSETCDGNSATPATYIKTFEYLDWINSTISSYRNDDTDDDVGDDDDDC